MSAHKAISMNCGMPRTTFTFGWAPRAARRSSRSSLVKELTVPQPLQPGRQLPKWNSPTSWPSFAPLSRRNASQTPHWMRKPCEGFKAFCSAEAFPTETSPTYWMRCTLLVREIPFCQNESFKSFIFMGSWECDET